MEKKKLEELERLLKNFCFYCCVKCSWTVQCQYFKLSSDRVQETEITERSIEEMVRNLCNVCSVNCGDKNKSCRDFELEEVDECSIPCSECYRFNLGLCKGYDGNEYCVTIDL